MELIFSWGGLSAFLVIVASAPYSWGIYTGKIKNPVISAWAIWSVIGLVFLFSSREAGATTETTLLAMIVGVVFPITNFGLSLKYGKRSWSKLDTWAVSICAITILIWQVFDSPLLGLIGACIADATGLTTQIKKTLKEPWDEPWFPWVVFCIASATNFLAIKEWEVEFWVYPAFMTLGSFIVASIIVTYYTKRRFQKPNHS